MLVLCRRRPALPCGKARHRRQGCGTIRSGSASPIKKTDTTYGTPQDGRVVEQKSTEPIFAGVDQMATLLDDANGPHLRWRWLQPGAWWWKHVEINKFREDGRGEEARQIGVEKNALAAALKRQEPKSQIDSPHYGGRKRLACEPALPRSHHPLDTAALTLDGNGPEVVCNARVVPTTPLYPLCNKLLSQSVRHGTARSAH